jgi:hypothetical protein
MDNGHINKIISLLNITIAYRFAWIHQYLIIIESNRVLFIFIVVKTIIEKV